jgi:hypothetical protein
VTSRLGTGKRLTIFYSVPHIRRKNKVFFTIAKKKKNEIAEQSRKPYTKLAYIILDYNDFERLDYTLYRRVGWFKTLL